LALSFVTIGMFVATIGFAMGLDTGVFRAISAIMLIGIGAVLLSSYLQEKVAGAASPLANWADAKFGGGSGQGLWGQAGVGLLLGAVWSPCVGPTLGAASVLASQGKDLAQVALTMLMFGIGAALPLLILGMLSRDVMLKLRGKMMSAGASAKSIMGAVLILIGLFVITDFDKVIEARLVDVMPDWLTAITTKY
jgi:cytochrome c-type biogenesis protein